MSDGSVTGVNGGCHRHRPVHSNLIGRDFTRKIFSHLHARLISEEPKAVDALSPTFCCRLPAGGLGGESLESGVIPDRDQQVTGPKSPLTIGIEDHLFTVVATVGGDSDDHDLKGANS